MVERLQKKVSIALLEYCDVSPFFESAEIVEGLLTKKHNDMEVWPRMEKVLILCIPFVVVETGLCGGGCPFIPLIWWFA